MANESRGRAARLLAQQMALKDVEGERDRQDDEFGRQVHDPAYWFAILGKQVGQLGEAIIRYKWATERQAARGVMYHEAQQVAGVSVALMEAIKLLELPDEITTAVPRDPRQRAKALGHGDEDLDYEGMGSVYERSDG